MDAGNTNLYIVFSSTQCLIGRFIRLFTRNYYNHVSFSLDPTLQRLYSFARYYKGAPFYAGFVEESSCRYLGKKPAGIKVCKVPLTPQQAACLKATLYSMRNHSSDYIYNTFSAFTYPFGKKILIQNAYTCLEFLVYSLHTCGIANLDPNAFYTIQDMEALFSQYVVFEGPSDAIFSGTFFGDDQFRQEIGPVACVIRSLSIIGALMKRMLHS